MMMPTRPAAPFSRSINPLANTAPAHSMNPNAVGQLADPTIPRPPAARPMGAAPGPQSAMPQIPPALLQNPQFLQLLQQMMLQQRTPQGGPMAGGFSRNLMGG